MARFNYVFEGIYERPAELAIYDITGRTVKTWEGTACGDVDLSWDLTEENGSPVSSGVYLASISDGAKENVVKVVVAK